MTGGGPVVDLLAAVAFGLAVMSAFWLVFRLPELLWERWQDRRDRIQVARDRADLDRRKREAGWDGYDQF